MSRFREYILAALRGKALPLILLCAYLCFLYALPRDPFQDASYSTVVLDRSGELLGARIADDGQWRFPPSSPSAVPERYAKSLIQFEDRHFRLHHGVNVLSVLRSAMQNLSEGRVVSGASTITMQVIRMSRGKERNMGQKALEALLAWRLERLYSKDGILALYASHAPFGGNVVGIDAASWRYFSHGSDDLSWGEAALLAVLPNSPSAIHPGRNRDALLLKRNRLLDRLFEKGYMDSTDHYLAVSEPLPQEPQALPRYAPHLTDHYYKTMRGRTVTTDIDLGLQASVSNICDRWNATLSSGGVADLSAVVIDVHSGKMVACIGNSRPSDGRPGAQVDIVRSPRSTGSILKPFLYCAMLQEGELTPDMLLPDIPVNINGFSPQNFDLQFEGAVPAGKALARSLNVPAVYMLRRFGVPRFHTLLKDCGMHTLTRAPSFYGLSLILGGAEGTLLDITRMYASLAAAYQGEEYASHFPLHDPVALYLTLDALKDVNRPDEMDWRLISSLRKVAWKTGTSYGFRDAWAVGVTADYAVGVWAGNAQGQGTAALVGARTAGPVLFDIFNSLPASEWFSSPTEEEGVIAEVCADSGHLMGPYCERADTLLLPLKALQTEVCPYHRPVLLSPDGAWRVGSSYPGAVSATFFLLPPSMEWFYRNRHPEYRPLPPAAEGSRGSDAYLPMEFIYPESGARISIPRQLDGSVKGVVFNLAHSDPDIEVFWHLDDSYVGSTRYIHQLRLSPAKGRHSLTVVDSDGLSLSITFTIE